MIQKLVIFLLLFIPQLALAQPKVLESYVSIGLYSLTAQVDDNGETFIQIKGDIAYMLDYMTGVFVSKHNPSYIEMISEGGNMEFVPKLGKIIKDNNLTVKIPEKTYCISACAYAALYSPDIQIDGILAFHLPWRPHFFPDETLQSITQGMVLVTLNQIDMLYDAKFKAALYKTIAYIERVSPDSYTVFTSSEELDKFRFYNPADFMAPTKQVSFYQMLDYEEIIELVK